MLRYDDALACLCEAAAAAPRRAPESLPLAEAAGRTLAAPVDAALAAPRAAVSAMDGYAVRTADALGGGWLTVAGTAAAGAPLESALAAGEAARIFTGGWLPEGADRVVIQEEAERAGDRVRWTAASPDAPDNIRAAGSDFRAGTRVLAAGRRLDPGALVAAAGADCAAVSVAPRPRLAIIANGDELAAPGTARAHPHAIPESAAEGVAALAAAWGGQVVERRRCGDDSARLAAHMSAALENADLLVVIGGASVGERDLARAAAAALGAREIFAKVAIKPGKPVWLAALPDGTPILGLPGNPGSALVTARLFLAPLLTGLQGGEAAVAAQATGMVLAAPLPATGERETFVRACAGPAGLTPVGNQDSGAQGALAEARWLIRCPPGQAALAPGARVQALPF